MLITQNLTKTFTTPKKITVFSGVDLEILSGDFLLIKGKSGSGKSTLLFILGGMLSPTKGKVIFENDSLYHQNYILKNQYRSQKIGFVFQGDHLLPYLNVAENISLGLKINNQKINPTLIKTIATDVGLGHRLESKPMQISAGERQRVALARAIIKKPAVIFADEPTGNLDKENCLKILHYLDNYRKNGGTVVMVTHHDFADNYASKILHMKNLNKNVAPFL